MADASSEPNDNKNKSSGGGVLSGWGAWRANAFATFSDLSKAAAEAADEISRSASVVAKSAMSDFHDVDDSKSDPAQEEKTDDKDVSNTLELTEEEKQRKTTLDRLEKASQDSLLGHGLKVFDNSVDTFASGAWHAFENAWKGGTTFVQKIENSASNLAGSIQQGNLTVKANSLAPTLLEGGKMLTEKGMQVLEFVGKEAVDLLATETGIEIEKDKEANHTREDEEYNEEVTFDHCFYIFGGHEQLEELEALSNHYALVCSRSKAKMSREEKASVDGIFKQVQQIFTLSFEIDGSHSEIDKGKSIECREVDDGNEVKRLCELSIGKAAEMASGFTNTVGGLSLDEISQKTTLRLEAIRTEEVHRVAELCCLGISQLLMLGKSVLSTNMKALNGDQNEKYLNIVWPEDVLLKAKFVRAKAQALTSNVITVSNSFTTGISDIIASFQEAIRKSTKEAEVPSKGILHENTIVNKAQTLTNEMEKDGSTAIEKLQDALQHLAYVVFSTSLKN
eukprot:TRINITY_DN885_c0_g1_i1.p1 TRINITY_DN885_c0_g1~~TRINITY_DN885_c0_g1_i1.p1  ORF type:complete len:508 (+),score=115.72 TRINITY_DN885_c0_g1_i1:332-1855(+)